MCCFSQPVISVSATNIFARAGDGGRQFLVYSMSINARSDLAMILPLPVKTPAGEKDVEFIDLKGYPDFFADLLSGFPPPPTKHSRGLTLLNSAATDSATLEVVKVGDFEASFVPKAFPRRDPSALFFPTVHIHDGKVHDRANFDHALYCQPYGEHHLSLGRD